MVRMLRVLFGLSVTFMLVAVASGQEAPPAEPVPAEGEARPPEAGAGAPAVTLPPPAAGEKHEFILGIEGRAELFLCDRTRIRVRGTEGGTGFAFYTKLTELEGSVVRIRSGEMTIHLGTNPVRVSFPFAEAVVAGPGTEVKITLEGWQSTFSRGGGEAGELTVYAGGKSEAIKPGAWTTLTAEGLGKGAKDGKPPESGEAASKIETFHYVTGKKGRGEIALPGGSHINLGHGSDVMLSANRSGVGPHFFAQMRNGNFAVRMKEETGLLLESRQLRYAFAAEGEEAGGAGELVVPPGERAAGEGEEPSGETPAKEGGGGESEDEPAWDEDESSRPPRRTTEGLVSIREEDAGSPAGEPGVKVENKGSIEMITNDTDRVLVLTVLDPRWEGMVVHVPPGAQVTVMVDADGNIMVHNLSSEIPVQVHVPKAGAKPVQIAPGEMVTGDPEQPEMLVRVPPELIDRIYETMTEPEEAPTPTPEPAPAPPPVESFVNDAPPGSPPDTVTPPEGEAYDDPGFVDEVQEASPYRP